MALNIGELFAKITVDTGPAQAGLTKFGSSMTAAGSKISGLGSKLTLGLTAPIVALGVKMFSAASDMEENINKINVAFKGNASEVQAWAKTATQNFGFSTNAALEMTSLFGDMATGMKFSTDTAADMSMGMAGLAGDLASFKNIGVDQASDALKGIFTGEGESLKSLGIIMTDATLSAYALSSGSKVLFKDMTQQEKVTLRYNYVLENTKNAQGDFARTSDGAANSARIFQANVDNLAAVFGTQLLPIFTPLIQKATELIQKFAAMSPEMQMNIMKVAAIVAAIGPALVAFGSMITAVGKISGAFSKALSIIQGVGPAITFLTGPIGLTIIALAALAAGVIYLWKTNETFKKVVITLWKEVQASLKVIIDNLILIFNAFVSAAQAIWKKHGDQIMSIVKTAFNLIAAVIKTAMNLIKNVIMIVTGLITGDWSRVWAGIKGLTATVFNGIKSIISAAFAFIRSVISTALSLIGSLFSAAWNRVKSSTSSAFNAIKTAMVNPINSAKKTISGILSSISGFFKKLKFAFPKISIPRLPRLTWTGKFSVVPPSVPKFKWVGKGAIFDQPTLTGIGERGLEAAVPLSGMAADTFAIAFLRRLGGVAGGSLNMGQGITVNVNGDIKDPATFAKMISREIQKETDRKTRSRGR